MKKSFSTRGIKQAFSKKKKMAFDWPLLIFKKVRNKETCRMQEVFMLPREFYRNFQKRR